jgi:GNAT superfamily N-acetyltransferase
MLLLADCCINEDYSLLCEELCNNGLLSTNKDMGTFWRSDFIRGNLNCEDIQLRDLCDNDLPLLISIHNSLKYYEDITGEAYSTEEAQALIDKTDLPPGGSKEFFCCKMLLSPEGQAAGYVMFYEGYPRNDTLWLGSLFIHRDYHRKGFGGKVIRTLTEKARESGYQSIGIGVYALNTSGLQFWVNQGFCSIDRVIVNEHQRTILALAKQL